MNYEEMTDFEINCRVAAIVEPTLNHGYSYEKENGAANFRLSDPIGDDHDAGTYNFCNNPYDAWPIIVENSISLHSLDDYDGDIGEYRINGKWQALGVIHENGFHYRNSNWRDFTDENPLRAAMIVFLMMKEHEDEN